MANHIINYKTGLLKNLELLKRMQIVGLLLGSIFLTQCQKDYNLDPQDKLNSMAQDEIERANAAASVFKPMKVKDYCDPTAKTEKAFKEGQVIQSKDANYVCLDINAKKKNSNAFKEAEAYCKSKNSTSSLSSLAAVKSFNTNNKRVLISCKSQNAPIVACNDAALVLEKWIVVRNKAVTSSTGTTKACIIAGADSKHIINVSKPACKKLSERTIKLAQKNNGKVLNCKAMAVPATNGGEVIEVIDPNELVEEATGDGVLANNSDSTTTTTQTTVGSEASALANKTIVQSIALGLSHSCALTNTGIVQCWGSNTKGQLGEGSTRDSQNPQVIDDYQVDENAATRKSTVFIKLAAGGNNTCAITNTNKLKCWGSNGWKQLGSSIRDFSAVPVGIDMAESYKDVSVGDFNTLCAITTKDKLKCWGYNKEGQVGNGKAGTETNGIALYSPVPELIDGNESYARVSVSKGFYTCAVTTSSKLKCWGQNVEGQLGTRNKSSYIVPTEIDAQTSYALVSAGGHHTCALLNSQLAGNLRCWGYNYNGQLGDGSNGSNLAMMDIDVATKYLSLYAGYRVTCGITNYKQLRCWGLNAYAQLGDGSYNSSNLPKAVDGNVKYSAVAVGDHHTCGVTIEGAVKCWGKNDSGQLGVGGTNDEVLPVAVSF